MLTSLLISTYPSWIYTFSENSYQLGLLFGSCGILSETNNNNNMTGCSVLFEISFD